MKKLLGFTLLSLLMSLVLCKVNITKESNLTLAIKNIEALATDEYNENNYRAGELICGRCNKEVQGCIACIEDGCSCTVPVHTCS